MKLSPRSLRMLALAGVTVAAPLAFALPAHAADLPPGPTAGDYPPGPGAADRPPGPGMMAAYPPGPTATDLPPGPGLAPGTARARCAPAQRSPERRSDATPDKRIADW